MSAIPIQLIQSADHEIIIKDGWPQWALIAHAMCYQPIKIFDGGQADYIFTVDGDCIKVDVKNGFAKYKIKSFGSDGAYVCDLIDSEIVDA